MFSRFEIMLRFIIIMILSIYLINRLMVFLFRIQGRPQPPPAFKRPPDGSVHVDSDPKKAPKKGGIQGGEYVDYEEIK